VDPKRVLRPLMQVKKILEMDSPPQPKEGCEWQKGIKKTSRY
jgi:hypothetical protein